MQTLLLLDLDGTLLDTPHYEAWRRAAHRLGITNFTHQQYVAEIAGRPRAQGASRLLALTQTKPCTAPGAAFDSDSLAQAKQEEFLKLAARAQLFDDARRLLERIETSGQCVRFYTASENAPSLFDAAMRKSGRSLLGKCVIQQRPGQTREALFACLASEHTPGAITLVDDAPHAVDAACRLGMRAYQIRRNAYETTAVDPSARSVPTLDDIPIPVRHS